MSAGAALGAVATFAHQARATVAGVPIPLGLLLGLVAVGCLVAGLRLWTGRRLPAALAAFGIVSVIGLLALPGPSGSALFPANLASMVWAVAPTLICVVVLAWPQLPGRGRPPGPDARTEVKY